MLLTEAIIALRPSPVAQERLRYLLDGQRNAGLNDAERAELESYMQRRDHWNKHFHLADTGVVTLLSARGRVTARLLRLNRLDLVADRAKLMALGWYPEGRPLD
jgi:hypothetical protein